MNQTWIVTAVVAVVAAGAAFFIGRSTAPQAEPEIVTVEDPEAIRAKEEAEEALRAALADKGAALSDPQQRETHLINQLDKERKEIERLSAELTELKAKMQPEEGPEGGPTPADPAKAGTKARYVYAGTEKALEALELDSAGDSLSKMTPLIDELLTSIAEGKPKMHLQAEISRYNMTLINQAVKMQGAGLSGEGINGVFTHPAIQVNYIYAALKAGEKPLSEKQEAELKEIGDRFVKEEARRMAGYNENTFALQRLTDEAELKQRFYTDVDGILTAEQVDVLHPEGMRGRIQADLFSSGLVWSGRAGVLPFKEREDLATGMADNAMRHLQLGSEHEALVKELAVDFANSFDDQFLAYKPDSLDGLGLIHESRVRQSARKIEGLLKALADRLPVDETVRKNIRATTFVLVPMKRGG